jgi:hypothetical protein
LNDALVPLAAAGIIGYLLYDRYFYRQQSEALNQYTVPNTPSTGVAKNAPRGIRNNNPGNIKWNASNNWIGQVGKDNAGFAIFDSADNGLRATGRLLKTYIRTHKLDTLAKIAPRWSPDGIGLSGAYAAGAAKIAGVGVNQRIDPNDAATMAKIIRGVVGQENGAKWTGAYTALQYTVAAKA